MNSDCLSIFHPTSFLRISPGVFDLPCSVIRRAFPFFIALLLFSACTTPSTGSQQAEMRSLLFHKKYSDLFLLSQKNALNGDPESEFIQGYLREYGLGTSVDQKKAVFWYKKSASHGNREAMNNLGVLYSHGLGVRKSDHQAIYWFSRSARLKNPAAYNNLALLLEEKGGRHDKRKAARYFLLSAKGGDADAMNNLGLVYMRGDGVPVNSEKARFWFQKAADHGLSEAKKNMDFLRPHGSLTYDQNSSAEIPDRINRTPVESWIQNLDPAQQTKAHKDWVAVIIGVDHYLLKGVPSAEFADNDARSMAAFLKKMGWSTILLEDGDASYFAVKNRILVWKGYPLHRFLVYFSGHGTLSSSGSPGLAPSDILPTGEGAIPLKTLKNWISQSAAQKKYLMLDACFSGGKRFFFPKGTRPLISVRRPSSDPVDLLEFDASQRSQESHVDPASHHGLFTEVFLEAVRTYLPDPKWSDVSRELLTRLPFDARSNGFDQNPSIRPANSPLLPGYIGSP
ncbi:MAG: caspase family protein [Leptospirillum sp.]